MNDEELKKVYSSADIENMELERVGDVEINGIPLRDIASGNVPEEQLPQNPYKKNDEKEEYEEESDEVKYSEQLEGDIEKEYRERDIAYFEEVQESKDFKEEVGWKEKNAKARKPKREWKIR